MAKNKGYDTNELMEQQEDRYTKPENKKRKTSQSRPGGHANGKKVKGGNRSKGVLR